LRLLPRGIDLGRHDDVPGREREVIPVAASINAWGSILEQLGGTHAKETSLITNPDTDPHDYEPTPADGRVIAGSKLFVENAPPPTAGGGDGFAMLVPWSTSTGSTARGWPTSSAGARRRGLELDPPGLGAWAVTNAG
jgi:hypothetical protein